MKAAFISMFLLGLLSALSFEVYPSAEIYGPGDTVEVYALLGNSGNETFYGAIQSTFSPEDGSSGSIVPYEVYVEPGSESSFLLYSFEVDGSYLPGEYMVSAFLVSPDGPAGYGECWLSIEGTPLRLDAWLSSCTDAACTGESSVFLVGESAFIVPSSSPEGAECTAVLSAPSGKTSFLELPAQITLSESGTYKVEADCSLEGHHSSFPLLMLGGLESFPSVATLQECNDDGVCDEGENHINCPQDCLPPAEALPEPDYLPILAFAAILFLAIIAWIFLRVRAGRK